ncbi:MAG TPA: YciI family protein [Trebonia sp.]|nr:YciI family protein [Trebonia sp.]
MKIVNYATYAGCEERVAALRPAHREYVTQLLAASRLVACGPFTDGSGGLFIYETDSLAAAEELVAADPYHVGGAFASYRLTAWDIIKANPGLIPVAR